MNEIKAKIEDLKLRILKQLIEDIRFLSSVKK